jgi:hypothetical protein
MADLLLQFSKGDVTQPLEKTQRRSVTNHETQFGRAEVLVDRYQAVIVDSEDASSVEF